MNLEELQEQEKKLKDEIADSMEAHAALKQMIKDEKARLKKDKADLFANLFLPYLQQEEERESKGIEAKKKALTELEDEIEKKKAQTKWDTTYSTDITTVIRKWINVTPQDGNGKLKSDLSYPAGKIIAQRYKEEGYPVTIHTANLIEDAFMLFAYQSKHKDEDGRKIEFTAEEYAQRHGLAYKTSDQKYVVNRLIHDELENTLTKRITIYNRGTSGAWETLFPKAEIDKGGNIELWILEPVALELERRHLFSQTSTAEAKISQKGKSQNLKKMMGDMQDNATKASNICLDETQTHVIGRREVCKLLAATDLPTIDTIHKQRNSWNRQLKSRLESYLDYMKDPTHGEETQFLLEWHYEYNHNNRRLHGKAVDLKEITTYEQWSHLVVVYTLAGDCSKLIEAKKRHDQRKLEKKEQEKQQQEKKQDEQPNETK